MKTILHPLYQRFPPSEPCSCSVCQFFCNRPGWWLVEEAKEAMAQGYAKHMMLEFAPDFAFGVLAPGFKGNEGYFALQEFSKNTCTFYIDQKCRLFGKGIQPLECRFCHHARIGSGSICHNEIEKDWRTSKGKRLVKQWLALRNLQPPASFQL